MKIIKLTFENLNSLYGSWSIDFTDPDYLNHGLFAITGATGSGKTTILDGICLALYGEVPRLGKITQSKNEIMSRKTALCSAEVVFENKTGQYLVAWHQHRARKKIDGKLSEYHHEISYASTGEIIESKKSLVPDVVEQLTGLNFERFTRSMMLAQGNFAAFLNADSNERSSILEQITGTEIYSKISTMVYDRNKTCKDSLTLLAAGIQEINYLSPDDELTIIKSHEQLQSKEKKLTVQLNTIIAALQWRQQLTELENELLRCNDELTVIGSEELAFVPQALILEQALKAVELEGAYSTLNSLRTELNGAERSLKEYDRILPAFLKKSHDIKMLVTKTDDACKQSELALQQECLVTKEVRVLDQNIEHNRQQQQALLDDNRAAQHRVDLLQDLQAKIDKQVQQLELVKKELTAYQDLHSADEMLITELKALFERINTAEKIAVDRLDHEKKITQQQEQIILSQKKSDKITSELKSMERDLEKIEKDRVDLENSIHQELNGKLLREYQTRIDTLRKEQNYLAKIASYEADRKKLGDTEACPLCGSLDHPYLKNVQPESDELQIEIEELTAQLAKVTQLEEQKLILEKRGQALKDSYMQLSGESKLTMQILQVAEELLIKLQAELELSLQNYTMMKSAIVQDLSPLAIDQEEIKNFKDIRSLLEKRLLDWNTNRETLVATNNEIEKVTIENRELSVKIESQTELMHKLKHDSELLEKLFTDLSNKRQQMYGQKNPDTQEELLQHKFFAAKEALVLSNRQALAAEQSLQEVNVKISSLRESIQRLQPKAAVSQNEFKELLKEKGFKDESQYEKARLDQAERNTLAHKVAQIRERKSSALTLREKYAQNLSDKKALKLSTKHLEVLQQEQLKSEVALRELHENIGSINHQLTDNKSNKDRYMKKREEYDLLKIECKRWESLNELIGSASGAKYRNFAQGLTFENLIIQSNRELHKMSDRYLLMRSSENQLELNVIDNHQGGEERTTKNLSGGESFIISMALALGLSKMSSNSVRVDSLFLDEGFGTLDEETLEVALDTLSGLHQEGKLIGVISHVETLKNRITTQIQVTPLNGGKSKLEGPGCTRL